MQQPIPRSHRSSNAATVALAIAAATTLLACHSNPETTLVADVSATASDQPDGRITDMLKQGFDEHYFHGIALAMKGDRVLYTGALGAADEATGAGSDGKTRFVLCSLSKTFTQVAILKLAHQGRLDLDQTLAHYRPGFQADIAQKVTIRQLLQMRAGLPRETHEDRRGVTYDAKGCAGSYLDGLSGVAFVTEPGTKKSYSNLGYWLLGAVIETVTDQTYEGALRTLIFDPLGMSDTGLTPENRGALAKPHVWQDDHWEVGEMFPVRSRYSSGGLMSSMDDLTRFYRSFWSDAVLSASSQRVFFNKFASDGPDLPRTLRVIGYVPGHTNAVMVDLETDTLVVALNNADILPPKRFLEMVRAIQAEASPSGQ
ncbi:MAG: D-alanyl-D-alanine carboxypeptidase [Planctomycetota bacterium]|jgi:CubicO group peptidase (beta-lactamase class C family)